MKKQLLGGPFCSYNIKFLTRHVCDRIADNECCFYATHYTQLCEFVCSHARMGDHLSHRLWFQGSWTRWVWIAKTFDLTLPYSFSLFSPTYTVRYRRYYYVLYLKDYKSTSIYEVNLLFPLSFSPRLAVKNELKNKLTPSMWQDGRLQSSVCHQTGTHIVLVGNYGVL